MWWYHVKHFSSKLTSFLLQLFEANAIILPILIAPNKESKNVMTPFTSDLCLLSPCMASHEPFCWVVSDFPNGFKFFL